MDRQNKLPLAATLAAGLALGAGGAWFALRTPAAHEGHAPAAAVATAPASAAERRVLYWYDPMVPGQKFDKPGKSPFMDMQLVPKYADAAAADDAAT
ncbi:MAG: heavy metal-binding domain-containing protein, partial [Rubrivivax sp.]